MKGQLCFSYIKKTSVDFITTLIHQSVANIQILNLLMLRLWLCPHQILLNLQSGKAVMIFLESTRRVWKRNMFGCCSLQMAKAMHIASYAEKHCSQSYGRFQSMKPVKNTTAKCKKSNKLGHWFRKKTKSWYQRHSEES